MAREGGQSAAGDPCTRELEAGAHQDGAEHVCRCSWGDRRRINDAAAKLETKDKKRIAELQKQGKDQVVNVRRFGEATLYRLLDTSEKGRANNALARLRRMEELQKKVLLVDGEWRRAKQKSRAATVRQKSPEIA